MTKLWLFLLVAGVSARKYTSDYPEVPHTSTDGYYDERTGEFSPYPDDDHQYTSTDGYPQEQSTGDYSREPDTGYTGESGGYSQDPFTGEHHYTSTDGYPQEENTGDYSTGSDDGVYTSTDYPQAENTDDYQYTSTDYPQEVNTDRNSPDPYTTFETTTGYPQGSTSDGWITSWFSKVFNWLFPFGSQSTPPITTTTYIPPRGRPHRQ